MKKDLTKIFIDEVYSKPPKKNYPSNKTIIKSIDDTWSSDLLDMNDYGPKNNKGYRYILVVIDNFSKFGWTIPLKNKFSQPITDVFSEIIKSSNRKPNLLETDDGKEYVNKIFDEFLNNNKIKRYLIELVHLLWDFDAVSLYPSAMWDENSIYPRNETGYANKKDMNDELVEKFNNQTFTRGSAILKIKYYNPKNLIVQHLPIKGKVKKTKINRMRNGYIIDTLTSVDIQEIVKIGGKVVEIYEGDIYRENFKISPFRRVIDILFKLRKKYKD